MKYGKPYLKNFSHFYFNISYSNDWIICGVDEFDLGIDIEFIQYMPKECLKYFFSKSERKYFKQKSIDEQKILFFRLWTLKESYIKFKGIGLNLKINTLNFKLNDPLKLYINNKEKKIFFKQYMIDNQYIISVCSMNNIFPENIIIKNINELFKEFNNHTNFSFY